MAGWQDALPSILGGLSVGAAVTAAAFMYRRGRVIGTLQNARTRAELLEVRQGELESELGEARAELERVQGRREQAERDLAALREKVKTLETAEVRLREAFRATGAETLAANSRQFLDLAARTLQTLFVEAKGDADKRQQMITGVVGPIKELLAKHDVAVRMIEQKRETAYARLDEQIRSIAVSHEKLGSQTQRLVKALRRPEQRGRWGEMQLRNAVELSGMTEHCDFQEQVQTDDDTTRDRPDMTVNVPGGGVIVVDSKVALDAYLDVIEADGDRDDMLSRHAKQVEKHVTRLASRRYWEQFERTPKLVVMFMPLESALTAALEVKPDLHAEAMRQHVLIATPTLIVALLRSVAYGWQQQDVAENARQISQTGHELYKRLATFAGHLESVGEGLTRTNAAYNSSVGSLQTMLLPAARRLKELHATTEPELDRPVEIEVEPREITASELRDEAVET